MSDNIPQPKSKPNNSKREFRKRIEIKSYPKGWNYLCWLVYLCYYYAAFVPTGAVWGIHFIAYLPGAAKILLLVAGGLLLSPKIQRP